VRACLNGLEIIARQLCSLSAVFRRALHEVLRDLLAVHAVQLCPAGFHTRDRTRLPIAFNVGWPAEATVHRLRLPRSDRAIGLEER